MKTKVRKYNYQVNEDVMPLIGRIDYLNSKGDIVDTTQYSDANDFIQDIKDELEWGVVIVITLYRGTNGKTIPTDWINDLDCLPAGFKVDDMPKDAEDIAREWC